MIPGMPRARATPPPSRTHCEILLLVAAGKRDNLRQRKVKRVNLGEGGGG